VSPGSYWAGIRDGLFDRSLHGLRGEGIFGARRQRRESSETRMLPRLMVYCLKVVARWLHG
jgi:hypothetical protein